MAKACVICGGDETSGETLLEAPCQRHWVCTDDVGSFFERATENESLYPPKCCGQIFSLDLYEAYVPFDVQWAYQMKEQGEYSVLAKYVLVNHSSFSRLTDIGTAFTARTLLALNSSALQHMSKTRLPISATPSARMRVAES
jgi:hypothetical protein